MNGVAFLFPGVGSQYTGMIEEYYRNFPVVRETFQEAGDILKIDLSRLCFEPEKTEELDRLANAQCALLAAGVALYRVIRTETAVEPQCFAGHSLGEYSALCCAGYLNFIDALHIVKERGRILTGTLSTIDGGMAWVIGLDYDRVEEICRQRREQGRQVFVSAYNSPEQTSISGNNDSLMETALILEKEGALLYPLKMSGPFHCPLMLAAAEEMENVLQSHSYFDSPYPVIANRTALPYAGSAAVVDNLSRQLTSPLQWTKTLSYLYNHGIDKAVEIGPKDILKFLTKKNHVDIITYSIDRLNDFEKMVAELSL